MENIKDLNIENEAIEIVTEVTEKLSFGENVLAYGIAATFVTGAITIGWLGYKGSKSLVKMVKNKKEKSVDTEDYIDIEDVEEVVDYKEEDSE